MAVCDIGSGLSMFPRGCAALGFQRVVMVDDFSGPGCDVDVLNLHRKYGAIVASRDVLKAGITDLGRFDVIASFDSLEHWHASPKALFREVMGAMNPGRPLLSGSAELREYAEAPHRSIRVRKVELDDRLV